MSGKYKFQPDYAVHPGETLREKLEELNMKPKELNMPSWKLKQQLLSLMKTAV